jgi:hypothetical protein
MSNSLIDVEPRRRFQFTKAEYDELMAQPRFAQAAKSARTPESFERLLEAAEEILKTKKATNPAARQYRHSQQAHQ